jgi:hypothetical protein
VDALAGSLSALNLEAVAPAGELDWSEAVRFGLVTADGLRLDVELVQRAPAEGGDAAEGQAAEAEHWIRLQAGLYQTAVDSAVEATGDSAAEADTEADGAGAVAQGAAEGSAGQAEGVPADATRRAADINRRVAGWAYRITEYAYESMSKRMEDLLLAEGEPDT